MQMLIIRLSHLLMHYSVVVAAVMQYLYPSLWNSFLTEFCWRLMFLFQLF